MPIPLARIAASIGVSGRIVSVSAIVDHFAAVADGNRGSGGKEQTVPEGHVGADRGTACLRELLGIFFVRDLLRSAFQQRAGTAFKDLAQVEGHALNAVKGRHLFGGFHFFFMLLSIVDGKSQDLIRSIGFDGKAETDGAVKAAAE